jgi:cell division protein FtsA
MTATLSQVHQSPGFGESDIVVGLDVGTTKICCMVGRKTEHGKVEIIGMGKAESHGVQRGVVSNARKVAEGIVEAVAQAEEVSDIGIKLVNVGIAGAHIRSIQHQGMIVREDPDAEIEDGDLNHIIESMYRMVVSPGNEILHVLPQEYMVDGVGDIKDPRGMTGARLEANFHMIMGNVRAAADVIKCVRHAGLEVADLILEPLASAEACLAHDEMEAGVVLVDIGGGTTDIAIFQDGIIRHTAVIPFGGNIITEDIKDGCSVMRNHAEQLKVKYGAAMANLTKDNEVVSIPGIRGREAREIYVRNLASIIQARLEEIVAQVVYEIKSSRYQKKLIAGIVLTGGGSMLKYIRPLFELHSGMDVRIGTPNEHLAKSSAEIKSPIFSTGVGLVMKGLFSNKPLSRNSTIYQPPTTSKKHGSTSILDSILKTTARMFGESGMPEDDRLG